MVRLAFDVQDPVEAGGQRLQGLRKGQVPTLSGECHSC